MKKIQLLLTFVLMSTFSKSQFLFDFILTKDTVSQGDLITLYIGGSLLNALDTKDTGRIYISNSSPYYLKQVFKININDLSSLPLGDQSLFPGCRQVQIAIPIIVGNFQVYCNSGSTKYNMLVRSPIPDLSIVKAGALSGLSGFSSYIKFKWTYDFLPTDTLKFYLNGAEIAKESFGDLTADSTLDFVVSGNPNIYTASLNYLTLSGWNYIINTPVSTAILEPFDSSKPTQTINCYDILGRPTTPKDGDMIRYTSIGAIVY